MRGSPARVQAALRLALCVAAALAPPGPGLAHPMAPALLELRALEDGQVEVRFKRTRFLRSRAGAEALIPLLPEDCAVQGAIRSTVEGTVRVDRYRVRCEAGLVGREVGVGGLAENRIDALLRVELPDGRSLQRVLRADRPTLELPPRPSAVDVLLSYLDMGVRHIFSGLDHLLFVLGLVLLVRRGPGYLRRLLVTLSAFTLGHCVTLSLAALGWMRVPGPPIEFAIALSVLLLAVELARGGIGGTREARLPWLLAASFGLLHGLGFGGALLEAGLPEQDVGVALLSFNLGIEAGQVLFVAAVLAAGACLRALPGVGAGGRLPDPMVRAPVYAMGVLAAFWCLERARGLLP